MMGRPTDWSPVGFSSDPIPGDPLQISGAVQRYRSTAEAIAVASANLQRLDGSALVSKAFQVAFERIQDVARKLDSTESRVRGAADALDRYWPELDRAQTDSLRELHQAEAQKADAKRYAAQMKSIANAYNSSSDPDYRASLLAPYQTAAHGNTIASHAVAEARRRIQDAIDARDRAAQTAISTLDDADALSPVKDNAWDKVSDWYEKNVLPVIKTVVKWVSDFAETWGPVIEVIGMVLSIAALFIPIPGVNLAVPAGIGAAFSGLSIAFSACKIANAGFELQDGRMSPEEYKAVCLTQGVSIGLSVVSIGLSAAGAAKAVTQPVATMALKQFLKKAAKDAASDAAKDAVEYGGNRALDGEYKTLEDLGRAQGEQRLQQERLDQEQRMIKVRQDYEQGRTSDSYSRQLSSSDLALAA